MLTIDVVVPTYNRSALLRKTIASLLRARVPAEMSRRIVVVDNNSPDDTRAVVGEFGTAITYVKECRQGSSSARNAGIAAGESDLVGFIDDDEEVDARWFEVVCREFQDAELDFLGGPYLPNWAAPPPSWLPPGYNAAIGVVAPKTRGRMDGTFPGNLMGGNAVLRRRVFAEVGTYAPNLGRSGKGLLSEEDAEFYGRLMEHGIYGLHAPDLVIHHYIPESRLTRAYHRRWAFWRAVSQGFLDRQMRQPVAYLLGVPRHIWGTAARNAARMPRHVLDRGSEGAGFAAELSMWDLAGFVYGKHMVNMDSFYGERAGSNAAESETVAKADGPGVTVRAVAVRKEEVAGGEAASGHASGGTDVRSRRRSSGRGEVGSLSGPAAAGSKFANVVQKDRSLQDIQLRGVVSDLREKGIGHKDGGFVPVPIVRVAKKDGDIDLQGVGQT